MRYSFVLLASLLVLGACQKDPVSLPVDESTLTLEQELESHAVSRTRLDAFGFVGNHPSFQRITNRLPIHLYLAAPNGASNLRYFETDSLRFRDSLNLFRQRRMAFERVGNGLMIRGAREDIRTDRYVRVSYTVGDSFYVTPPMTLRAATLETGTIDGIRSATNAQDFYQFSWGGVPGTDQYFLVLEDVSGDAIMGLTTERSSFQFYDLRNVRENFFPQLRDPQLVEGASYTLHIYALTTRGWLIAQGRHTFTFER